MTNVRFCRSVAQKLSVRFPPNSGRSGEAVAEWQLTTQNRHSDARERSPKAAVRSECLGEAELGTQTLLVIEGDGGECAAVCELDGGGKAGDVPVALVDAG